MSLATPEAINIQVREGGCSVWLHRNVPTDYNQNHAYPSTHHLSTCPTGETITSRASPPIEGRSCLRPPATNWARLWLRCGQVGRVDKGKPKGTLHTSPV